MDEPDKIDVVYFTDILCIWAYIAQIRIDELKSKFGRKIHLNNHFIPVFGSVDAKMEQNWDHKGGVSAYGEHVRAMAAKFEHIDVHPDIWTKNTPSTSTSCHLFLKSIQMLESRGELPATTEEQGRYRPSEAAVWEFRLAFFKDLINIADFHAQMEIAERLQFPVRKIEHLIKTGEAFSALDKDFQLKEKYVVSGSPTLVLNEGRQIIYGNVGYRVIEANIQELLNQPGPQASWC